MKKYDAYKDSGVKWIGEIPNHWEAIKISRVHPIIGSGTTPLSSREDYYSEKGLNWLQTGDLNNGLITETSKKITPKAVDECKMKFYPIHSVVIAMYGATIGKVGLLDIETATNQACCIIVPSKRICPKYTFYSFIIAKEELLLSSFGGGQPNISQDIIRKLKVPVPPLSEQQSIASYLDVKTEKIDKMIAKAEKKIEYLGELKQSLITRAVTRGLNPNAPLKDSGVKWIGDIPRDWEIPRLNFVTSKIGSGSTPKGGSEVYVDEGVVFLRSQNVYNDGLRLNDVVHIVPSIHEQMKGTKVQVDDILFNITGASIGRCCRFTKGIGEANVNQHVCIVRPKNILPTFLMYCLQSFVGQTQLRQLLKGGNREGLSGESFKNFYVLLPSPNEQQQIATYLDIKCSKIDHIVATQKKKIAYLQELKQSLITNVVTGKIKVS